MTVLERQGRPATLQVDAIALRLTGPAMVAEVVRFLRAEFSHFATLAVFRREGSELVALTEEDATLPASRPPLSPEFEGLAFKPSAVVPSIAAPAVLDPRGPGPCLMVPVRSDGELVGLILVQGFPGTEFDGSDRRFLQGVATRLGPALSGPVGARLL